MSCCQECSCDVTCVILGNCCPDYDISSDLYMYDPPEVPCTADTTIVNNGIQFHSIGRLYRFIDYCPSPFHSSETTIKLCNQPETLDDRLPVVNIEGDKLFKNKYCASCHGYQNVVPWEMYLDFDCRMILGLTFDNFTDRDSYISNNCILYAFPPPNARLDLLQCRPTDVVSSRCNITQMWSKYDPVIESKCLNFDSSDKNSLVRHPSLFGYMYFSNIFCYLCNVGDAHDDVCPAVNHPDDGRSLIHGMAIFLQFQDDQDDTTEKASYCPSNAVYDPYLVSSSTYLCFVQLVLLFGPES